MTPGNDNGKEQGKGFSGLSSLIPEVEDQPAVSVPPAAPAEQARQLPSSPHTASTSKSASFESNTAASVPEKPASSWDWVLPAIVGFVLVKLSGLLGVLICFGAYYFLKPKIGKWGAIAASAGIVVVAGLGLAALATPATQKDCIAKYRVHAAGTQQAVRNGYAACNALVEGKSNYGNFDAKCVLSEISQVKADNGLRLLLQGCANN
jgi:hypothetical protein